MHLSYASVYDVLAWSITFTPSASSIESRVSSAGLCLFSEQRWNTA